MNVDAMLRNMSWVQFCEWRAYADMEPWDEVRADLRAAQIEKALYNIFTRKKGQKVHKIDEFVLNFSGEAKVAPKKDWRELKAIGKQWVMAHNRNLRQEQQRARKKKDKT